MFKAEYTDTFGGESNYSWVKRANIETQPNATTRQVLRAARKALGLTGIRGRIVHDQGDFIEWRPYGICTVLFVTFEY